MNNQAIYFEYTSAAVPVIDELKPLTLHPDSDDSITTPNLLARYLRINKNTMNL